MYTRIAAILAGACLALPLSLLMTHANASVGTDAPAFRETRATRTAATPYVPLSVPKRATGLFGARELKISFHTHAAK